MYTRHAGFEARTLEALLADYDAVRTASVTLFRGLDETAWRRFGTVNDYAATPRGLAFHIVGHELHHHRLLHARYVPVLQSRRR